MLYAAFCVWLQMHSSLRFIHVVSSVGSSFLSIAEQHSPVCLLIQRFELGEIYCKEMAHAWRVQTLQGKLAGWRPRKELKFQLEPEGSPEAEFSLPPRAVLFSPGPSHDWMRPTILWRTVCLTKSLLV